MTAACSIASPVGRITDTTAEMPRERDGSDRASTIGTRNRLWRSNSSVAVPVCGGIAIVTLALARRRDDDVAELTLGFHAGAEIGRARHDGRGAAAALRSAATTRATTARKANASSQRRSRHPREYIEERTRIW